MSLLRGNRRYRTSRDIVVPKGTKVVYVRHMKHEVEETAVALVNIDQVLSFDWMMNFDDALAAGLIEEAE